MFNDSIFDAQNIELLRKKISQANNVVICVHVSPDGDAVGSATGLAAYLRQIGKNVTIIFPNQMPDFLKVVPSSHDHLRYDRSPEASDLMIKAADLIFCLDFNSKSRITDMGEKIAEAKAYKIMIDHHLDPDLKQFGHVVSHPELSSTSELLFRLIDAMGETKNITFAGAEDLYAGIATDTGFFSFNSNDPDLFVIVSELLRKGIDKDRINRNIQNNYSADRLKFIGYVLYEKLQVFPDLHASLFAIKKEELDQFHYMKGDMEGVVNMPLQIKGHKLSIALREDTERPLIRVSTRSVDDLPCNEFCEQFFNGGGHKNAAGGTLECSMEEAVDITLKALEAWRDRLEDKPQTVGDNTEKAE